MLSTTLHTEHIDPAPDCKTAYRAQRCAHRVRLRRLRLRVAVQALDGSRGFRDVRQDLERCSRTRSQKIIEFVCTLSGLIITGET